MNGKLVDTGKPGDRVETYFDYLHLKKTKKSRKKVEDILDLDNGSGDKVDDDVPYDQDKKVDALEHEMIRVRKEFEGEKVTYGDPECIIVTEIESFKQRGLQIDQD
ncbi:hypothetical protein GIB67_002423 [Kingdonia uniflora]|uniref:Uncharacterized protein n=1 Tax=Kingdonia uniflora TaxID=39325 RepID=A0A7J7MPR7_9MAGN|nr:hypothetical protein GIB67_002423 [Kingdonia uniflora]